jgi:hypothetical protein
MATPDYAKDKNDLPLYTDQIGTERLVIVAGNILDSANNVYIYDRVNDVLTDDATPANRILQPPTGLRVREAQADAVREAVREATAAAVAAATTTSFSLCVCWHFSHLPVVCHHAGPPPVVLVGIVQGF